MRIPGYMNVFFSFSHKLKYCVAVKIVVLYLRLSQNSFPLLHYCGTGDRWCEHLISKTIFSASSVQPSISWKPLSTIFKVCTIFWHVAFSLSRQYTIIRTGHELPCRKLVLPIKPKHVRTPTRKKSVQCPFALFIDLLLALRLSDRIFKRMLLVTGYFF